ncbi:MAG TPA: divalent-cation tolerance protein CutA [Blastocatellia bacterium]|nr:divalent-cation tolerance protein CutA [Blastocatellia bacterium]
MSHELIVFVTTPNNDEAARIADALVSERLAACVNIITAIESIYRWEGKVTRDSEALMIIKTTDERYAELERRVRQLHSYSTPEIVALRIERGSEQYLNWLRDSTAADETR